jgi:hypothetical protein
MEFLKKNKIAIGAAVLVVVGFALYSIYFTAAPDLSLAREDGGGISASDREFLTLLQSLEGVRLDAALFESAAFQSLIDFSRALNPEAVGRDNPFAPIDAGAAQNPR